MGPAIFKSMGFCRNGSREPELLGRLHTRFSQQATLVSRGHSTATHLFKEGWVIPCTTKCETSDGAHLIQFSGFEQKWLLETRVVERNECAICPTTLVSSGHSTGSQLFKRSLSLSSLRQVRQMFQSRFDST